MKCHHQKVKKAGIISPDKVSQKFYKIGNRTAGGLLLFRRKEESEIVCDCYVVLKGFAVVNIEQKTFQTSETYCGKQKYQEDVTCP